MNDAQFLNLIRQIRPIAYDKIGMAISFMDIYKVLSFYGEDQDSIRWRINQLEHQHKIEVFRNDLMIYAVRVLV